MHLYQTSSGVVLSKNDLYYAVAGDWDEIVNRDELHTYLNALVAKADIIQFDPGQPLLAPIGTQEVWAAGVTYLRSRDARKEESRESGAADCYDKVYEAERPELFFKSVAHRVVGHCGKVNIRRDSSWNVPEPELALFINSKGSIQGYTIGNDMSSRSIEGENPLYLPQAKVYEGSASLGPALYIPDQPIDANTMIQLVIRRRNETVFEGSASIGRMKRSLGELASYLTRELFFPQGVYLMTGTCIVPPAEFTLQPGDRIEIEIEGIGRLYNTVSTFGANENL